MKYLKCVAYDNFSKDRKIICYRAHYEIKVKNLKGNYYIISFLIPDTGNVRLWFPLYLGINWYFKVPDHGLLTWCLQSVGVSTYS